MSNNTNHKNQLILGDNLEVLKTLPSESVDLIYIDPPFNSNRNYIGAIGSVETEKKLVAQFEDTWKGGMDTYIHNFMYPIVLELHRVLKPTGSFYLHCDHTAQAYMQVHVLDPIFKAYNFQNEIIWHYTWGVRTDKRWNRKHDVIFFYTKSKNWTFNANDVLEDRQISEATAKRLKYKGALITDGNKGRGHDQEKALPTDTWYIATLNVMAKERTGYPTQKPEALLERIILASSNEGDVVLDCFCGSGTTVVVAEKLGRQWIGIDHSPTAISVTKARLDIHTTQKLQLFKQEPDYEVITKKYDYNKLRTMDDFEFEKFVMNKLCGKLMKDNKGAGLDGLINNKTVVEIKRQDRVGRTVVDKLQGDINRYKRENPDAIVDAKPEFVIKINKGEIDFAQYDGVIVAFSFSKDAYAEEAALNKAGLNILLLTVDEIIAIAKPPIVTIKHEIIENKYRFTAVVETEEKIENKSWCVWKIYIKDKKQEKLTLEDDNLINEHEDIIELPLKSGEYKVVCEVIDVNGLSGEGELEVVVA